MSLMPDTIAIRNKPFVRKATRFAKKLGEKTLSKVVQQLAEERMTEIETGQMVPAMGVGSESGKPAESSVGAA